MRDVRVLNLLDEGLLTEVEPRRTRMPSAMRRLEIQIGLAVEAGADAVLLHVYGVSTVVPAMQRFPPCPCWRSIR
jgi:hypothetical protein